MLVRLFYEYHASLTLVLHLFESATFKSNTSQLATRMTSIGKIEEYKPDGKSIAAYLERAELFFAANNIEDDKKVTVFLSVLGASMYTPLRDLVAPTKPSEKSFAPAERAVKKHYEPTRIVIAERFYFHRRSQQPGESIAQYMAELLKLAIHCEFADYLKEASPQRPLCMWHTK